MATIIQINVCNNIYSTGKIAGAIGDLIVKRGWKSYIAYQRAYKESLSEPIKIGCWIDTIVNAIEQRLFDNTGFGIGSYFSTKQLVRRLKEINPDIIHLHVIHGYYLQYNVLFKYLATLDIPIVWTLHSCWEVTGHCTHFDYEGCERWKTECYSCPLKREYPQSYLLDRSKKNYHRKKELFNSLKNLYVVTVSKWLNDVVSESFFKAKPRRVIYNGIDLQTFRPSKDFEILKIKKGLEGKFVAIGVASSWLPKKGLCDYFKLEKMIPNDFSLVLIGLSDKQIKCLPSGIIGIRKTKNIEELRDWYVLSDVVLNLSYEETFGLTTVEGMACGTPSIVYDRTASPELVSEDTGYVVKAGDVANVLDCMLKIKEKGKISFVKHCRNRAELYFDKDKNFQEYMRLYDRLLNLN